MTNQLIIRIIQQLGAPDANLLTLLETYQVEEYRSCWQQDTRLYRAFGAALISASHFTCAFDLVRTGLCDHPDDVALQYLSALALARGGNDAAAMDKVEKLLQIPTLPSHLLVEILSLAGRLAKDRYARASSPALKTRYAAESAARYEQAHGLSSSSFPSINAATMTLLADHPEKACDLAGQAAQRALAERQKTGKAQDYWLLATLGEACLLLRNQQEAVSWYRQAIAQAAGRLGDIAAMRRQVQLLAEKMPVDAEMLELFDVGHVVVFSGHMIDHPARLAEEHLLPRFPADIALERSVSRAIQDALNALNATVGYSSAACGADILFAERMLERGKELHIVLPFKKEDFYTTSVDFGLAALAGWRQRCDAVLAQATEVHYATTQPFLGDESLFAFVNTVTQGLAITRAAQLGVQPYALVVRDPAAPERIGGTAYFVQSWHHSGGRMAPEIDLAALRSGLTTPLTAPVETFPPQAPMCVGLLKREVKAMLFGDIKHFSHLDEAHVPLFLFRILDDVASMLAETRPAPAFYNTWGDGLFLVFDTVRDCADFALRLLDRLGTVGWEDIGLPADTAVRLGLHAGPVYPYMDRILGRRNFFGSSVSIIPAQTSHLSAAVLRTADCPAILAGVIRPAQ